jgi:hypothetical protein
MTIPVWWERFPGLREAELAALDAAGLAYEIDEAAERVGILRIRVTVVLDATPTDLVATYPDLYPYFRFEVEAPGLDLGRHQNPFRRTLCLIGRRTDNWNVSDTLAAFITERVPLVLETAADPDADTAAEAEEHQGEPFSDYFTYQHGAVVLVDGSWDLSGSKGGDLTLAVPSVTPDPTLLRGIVRQVRDASGNVLGSADDRLAERFDRNIRGRWRRLKEPPQADSPDAVIAVLAELDPKFEIPQWQRLYDNKFDVVAGVFSEEVQWRSYADTWLFVVRVVPTRPPGLR